MTSVLIEDKVAMRVSDVYEGGARYHRGWLVADRRDRIYSPYPTAMVVRGARDGDFVCEKDGLALAYAIACIHVRAVKRALKMTMRDRVQPPEDTTWCYTCNAYVSVEGHTPDGAPGHAMSLGPKPVVS